MYICDPGPQNQSYVSINNRIIEKIAFKVVQMKFLAMRITIQKLSWYLW